MLFRALVFLFAALLFAAPASAAKKIALLIGNAEYSGGAAKLSNPPNDVEAMRVTLTSAGFEVHAFTDLTRIGMSKALREFEQASIDADIGVVFYSGHGIEVGGANYLIPVDAQLETDRDAKYEAIDLDDVLVSLANIKLLKLVLLDACRDNPFLGTMKSSTKGSRSKGLARIDGIDGQTNLLIGYATAPKEVALDGDGKNSPFTKALVAHLVEPGVEVQAAFRSVAKEVYTETKGAQRPYTTGSIFETVMLGPEKADEKPVERPAFTVEEDPCGNAASHWNAIKDRKNADLFKEHLSRFGTCDFSTIAKIELAALEQPLPKPDTAILETPPVDLSTGVLEVPKIDDPEAIASLYRSIQTELGRVGCYQSSADGDWGPASQRALRAFNGETRNTFNTEAPEVAALGAIKAIPDRVCPLICSPREQLQNGACVLKTCSAGQRLTDGGSCVAVKGRENRVVNRRVRDKVQTTSRPRGNCFSFNGQQVCE